MSHSRFSLAGWPPELTAEDARALRGDLDAFLDYRLPVGLTGSVVTPGDPVVVISAARCVNDSPELDGDSRWVFLGCETLPVGSVGEVLDGPDGDGDVYVHFPTVGAFYVNLACLGRVER
jgi:hypothetical protein